MKVLLADMRRFVGTHPLVIVFMLLAVGVRLGFWLYSGRVWEDALITLAPARNAWLGNGLTHHFSEPRVYSFTSPISILVPLGGEAFHQGLLALRLASLGAAAATIYYAYRIGEIFKFHWSAQILLLSYLATDQLQIFFGMAGMETQMATAIFLAAFYYLMREEWRKLGLATGAGMLARPEFVFCLAIIGFIMLAKHRKNILSPVPAFLCTVLPWYLFTYFYYGTIVPNTIIAKSMGGHNGPFARPLSAAWQYFTQSATNIAPFKEWYFVVASPIPSALIDGAVAAVVGLTLIGVIAAAIHRDWRLLAVAAAVMIFIVYRSVSQLEIYYMWYLVPFLALFFVIAAYGLSFVAHRNGAASATIACVLALAYGIHMPFSFATERKVQKVVECGVRYKTGVTLAGMMGPTDDVVLGPLGYIGYAAFNKTIYDFPGLGTKATVRKLFHLKDYRIIGFVAALKPAFIVLRPDELTDLRKHHPDLAANYLIAAEIRAAADAQLETWGYSSEGNLYDGDFFILRRLSPATEYDGKVHPIDPKAADVYHICGQSLSSPYVSANGKSPAHVAGAESTKAE